MALRWDFFRESRILNPQWKILKISGILKNLGIFIPGIGDFLKFEDFNPGIGDFIPGIGDFRRSGNFCPRDWGFLSPEFFFKSRGYLRNPQNLYPGEREFFIPGILLGWGFLGNLDFFGWMGYPTKKPPLNNNRLIKNF